MNMIRRLETANGLLACVVLLGLALRMWGIDYGLPYTYGPDEPTYVTITLQMFRTGDLNPHWWYYPSLMFYLNAGAYIVYFLVGRLLGVLSYASPALLPLPQVITLGVGKLALPAEFLISRGMVALFSAASILLVYAIAERLDLNRWLALLAALFFAVSSTVVGLSHRFAPDIIAMFFALAAVYFALGILERGRMRDYVLAGVAAGLAVSAKYNVGIVLLALIAAHLLRTGWAGWRRKEIYVGLAVAALAFVVGTPFAVLDFSNFWDGVRWQAFSYTVEGHTGEEGNALAWYVSYLWQSEGLLVLFASLSILVAAFKRRPKALVVLVYPIVYFVFVSLLLSRNDRTIMQVIPFVCVLGAEFLFLLFDWVSSALRRPRVVASALLLLAALLIVPRAANALAADRALGVTDSRETARAWISGNLPAGSRIAVEGYSPYVDPARYSVHGEFSMIDRSPDWYVQNGYEYLVFSYGAYGRYYENPDQYSDAKNQYDAFFARFPEVKRFDDNGYPVRILKTNVAGLPSLRTTALWGVYGPLLEFAGYDLVAGSESTGLDLAFYWRAIENKRDPLTLTTRLLDHDNRDVADSSGLLFGTSDSNGAWPAGIVRVPWKIAASGLAAGVYRLELDVDAQGMGRIPVLSLENVPVSDKFYLGPIKIAATPPSEQELTGAAPAGAEFGGLFGLQAYHVDSSAHPGSPLNVRLYWRSNARTDSDYTMFVHLLDASGAVRAQVDAQPRGGAYPTSIWTPGETIRDDYALSLPAELAPGSYRLEVGAYEYPSLKRLAVVDANGQGLGDHLVLDTVVSVR
ncbi:MAG: glycosyltransferase family 39 protein [Chloroflexi bacterium]|nr:glycosyltransferase family 39 protein [Chloroflexota bacterium]